MNLYKSVAFIICTSVWLHTAAQSFPEKKYDRNYFQWPLQLAPAMNANFGELRPNHYHMGLDCKTDKRENIPVLAAAEGYVAKVKIEPWGFGRAIYINHPNGTTTVYAHLNDFYAGLEKYITEQQYKLKTWAIFIDIDPSLFPVTKGMEIAKSGNTGGSQGPHLHFEIRDTKTDKVLNPSLFRIALADNVAPVITRLAMYDRCMSVYEQSPRILPLKKAGNTYTTASVINIPTDEISFAIGAFDTYSGSSNPNGIYEAVLYHNETAVVGFQLDSIGYDETRYINAHIDYKMKTAGGAYVQHLSKLPGHNNSVYKEWGGNGVIKLEDSSIHNIKINVKDANGNLSTIQFSVKRSAAVAAPPSKSQLQPASSKMFHPGHINVFENSNISFFLNENALYDSIRFAYKETPVANGYPIYQLHNAYTPLHSYFPVKIKADVPGYLQNKIMMRRFWNGKGDYKKAVAENGWYKASFREFGMYQLVVDTTAPAIVPLGFKDGMNAAKLTRIAFSVTDNTEEIKQFTALLDGNWLRFSNDKGKNFIYKFDEYCPPGQHLLKIIVEDVAGNSTEKVYNFSR